MQKESVIDQHSNALSDGSGAGGQGKRGFPGDSGGDSERHDDYEYMRSALPQRVVDYLLKPVKLMQIQEVLLSVRRIFAAGRRNLSETATTGRHWKTGSTVYSQVKPASGGISIRCSGLHGFGGEGGGFGLRKSCRGIVGGCGGILFSQRNARRSCAVEYRKQRGHCKAHIDLCQESVSGRGGTALFCSESTVYAFGGVSCVL